MAALFAQTSQTSYQTPFVHDFINCSNPTAAEQKMLDSGFWQPYTDQHA
jgi:hypothetical protein